MMHSRAKKTKKSLKDHFNVVGKSSSPSRGSLSPQKVHSFTFTFVLLYKYSQAQQLIEERQRKRFAQFVTQLTDYLQKGDSLKLGYIRMIS